LSVDDAPLFRALRLESNLTNQAASGPKDREHDSAISLTQADRIVF
jgi:hypothetical protein